MRDPAYCGVFSFMRCYCSAILRTSARAVPSASPITRKVFELNSMPVRRKLVTEASTSTPSAGFSNVVDRRIDAFECARRERLEIDHGVVGQRLLQIGNCRARGGAEQAEGCFRLHVERDVGQPHDLVLLIEHGLAPDVHGRLGAEPEPALGFLGLDAERNQQPVARRRDARRQHRDLARARRRFRGRSCP